MTLPPTGHRLTYYRGTLGKIETARYRDEDGNELVIESHHATLTDITPFPVAYCGDRVRIHRATDAEGREVYLRKYHDHTHTLRWAGSQSSTSGHKLIRYYPGDEWGVEEIYDTAHDAQVISRDSRAYKAEYEAQTQMLERAHAAAAAIDGEGVDAWSRAAYEGACAAAGLDDPASDEDALHLAGPGGGVYAIPQYHREHVVWVQLAYRRAAGIEAETIRAEQTALERAEQAAGTGPYSRDDYERACAAAGIAPLDDDTLPGLLAVQLNNQYGPICDILGGLAVERALGATPQTAATLAGRRETGMHAELDEQRAAERETLAAEEVEFATDEQVTTIMRLLARRERTGEGGGFFMGPTDRGGVANLSKQDASAYITSLRGDY